MSKKKINISHFTDFEWHVLTNMSFHLSEFNLNLQGNNNSVHKLYEKLKHLREHQLTAKYIEALSEFIS